MFHGNRDLRASLYWPGSRQPRAVFALLDDERLLRVREIDAFIVFRSFPSQENRPGKLYLKSRAFGGSASSFNDGACFTAKPQRDSNRDGQSLR